MERFDTIIVGGGQAGIATSEHLTQRGIDHVVLERGRIAERWRSERWDSLVANGPAWHDRFPGLDFPCDRDGFPGKEVIAQYFEDYAAQVAAPVRTGVAVSSVTKPQGAARFVVETSAGPMQASHIVAATGPFQKPIVPPVIPAAAPVSQMHSSAYRNPDQLADGAVLVIGAGSSGTQIAEELMLAGREVFLSVGPHDRPPRAYRGRDFCWWLGVLGKWNLDTPDPGTEHVTIAVSGARGGRSIDFRRLGHEGITLLGMTQGYSDGALSFAGDLTENLNRGDANYLSMLDQADAMAARQGWDLPAEPEARKIPSDPASVQTPIRRLDLQTAGISTVIWATGYGMDYGWLKLGSYDARGKPIHQRGVGTEPGLYFVGLPWQSRRGSSFIWGVWHDAKFIADQIAIQRGYMAYHRSANGA